MITEARARLIVYKIIEDLSDRRGLRQVWETIDPAVRREIRNEWITIVQQTIAPPDPQ